MKPLKVLILITKANWGGAQRYVFDVATRLPKDIYSVEVMAGGDGPLIKKLWDAGIHATGDLGIGRDVSLWQDFKAFFHLVSYLRRNRPDVLHVNSSKIGALGALAGRLARIKRVVFTAHGWAFNEDRPFIQKILIKIVYWLTILWSDKTISVSESMARQVISWPLVKDRVVAIHNGISKETGFSRSNARLELARLCPQLMKVLEGTTESNSILIGTIAELHPIKGYQWAIQAVSECVRSFGVKKKVIYAIISDGQDRGRISSMIEHAGMEEHILLLGHIDNAAQYVNAFDVFLLASVSEGLGYVLLEAGASSVPIVATAVGGIPEIIDDMCSGILVQPRNARELSHAISFMIEHPEERRRYGAALRDKVMRDFTLGEMIGKIEGVYRG